MLQLLDGKALSEALINSAYGGLKVNDWQPFTFQSEPSGGQWTVITFRDAVVYVGWLTASGNSPMVIGVRGQLQLLLSPNTTNRPLFFDQINAGVLSDFPFQFYGIRVKIDGITNL